jgi:hypothetical protein
MSEWRGAAGGTSVPSDKDAAARPSPSDLLLEPPSVAVLEASLLMWGLCRSAPSALRVSFASKSNHAVLALRAYNLKGEP